MTQQMPMVLPTNRVTALAATSRLSQEAKMHSNFLFLGDSHIGYFQRAMQLAGFLGWQYQVCSVNGATAVGLRNPQAPVNALATFRRFLQDKNRQSTVVLHLGETDCSFLFWYRAKKFNEPVIDQMRVSVAAYIGFVHELRRSGFIDVVITGATPPTTRDDHDWGNDYRQDVTASLEERTKATLDYNKSLLFHTRELGLRYLDINTDILDPTTRVVRPDCLNPDPTDHHLDYHLAGALWAERICQMVASEPRRRRLSAA